jgi:hypothetical protein
MLPPFLQSFLRLGDPGGDLPPERGRRVIGLEVRHLALDAALWATITACTRFVTTLRN